MRRAFRRTVGSRGAFRRVSARFDQTWPPSCGRSGRLPGGRTRAGRLPARPAPRGEAARPGARLRRPAGKGRTIELIGTCDGRRRPGDATSPVAVIWGARPAPPRARTRRAPPPRQSTQRGRREIGAAGAPPGYVCAETPVRAGERAPPLPRRWAADPSAHFTRYTSSHVLLVACCWQSHTLLRRRVLLNVIYAHSSAHFIQEVRREECSSGRGSSSGRCAHSHCGGGLAGRPEARPPPSRCRKSPGGRIAGARRNGEAGSLPASDRLPRSESPVRPAEDRAPRSRRPGGGEMFAASSATQRLRSGDQNAQATVRETAAD